MERQLCSGTASGGAHKKACGEGRGEQTKSGVASKKALEMILNKKEFFLTETWLYWVYVCQ